MVKKSCRGLTIVEIIIAFTLFSIIGLLIATAFSRTSQLTKREAGILEVEQKAHFIAQSIEDDLQASGVAGISYFTRVDTPFEGFAASAIADVTNEGALIWEGEKVVYFWSEQAKVLKKALLQKGGLQKLPAPLALSDLTTLASAKQDVALEMADEALDFSVRNERNDGSGRLVNISIELESDIEKVGNRRRYRVNKRVALKN